VATDPTLLRQALDAFHAAHERALAASIADLVWKGWMSIEAARFQVAKMSDMEARYLVFEAIGDKDPLTEST
jgi:hypothetical protein